MCVRSPGATSRCTKNKCNLESTKARKRHEEELEIHMLHVQSPLPADLEKLIHDTIGCCIAVHRALGPGLLEMIYSKAVRLELTAAGISFEQEKRYPVIYRGE